MFCVISRSIEDVWLHSRSVLQEVSNDIENAHRISWPFFLRFEDVILMEGLLERQSRVFLRGLVSLSRCENDVWFCLLWLELKDCMQSSIRSLALSLHLIFEFSEVEDRARAIQQRPSDCTIAEALSASLASHILRRVGIARSTEFCIHIRFLWPVTSTHLFCRRSRAFSKWSRIQGICECLLTFDRSSVASRWEISWFVLGNGPDVKHMFLSNLGFFF